MAARLQNPCLLPQAKLEVTSWNRDTVQQCDVMMSLSWVPRQLDVPAWQRILVTFFPRVAV